jgi:hypothetical protein
MSELPRWRFWGKTANEKSLKRQAGAWSRFKAVWTNKKKAISASPNSLSSVEITLALEDILDESWGKGIER